jgi:hypothetical protein
MEAVLAALDRDVQRALPAFEKQHGKLAAALLPHLGAIFQLLRRVPFDLDLPQRARHRAAAAALYILDPDDYLGQTSGESSSLIDDVWIAAKALDSLAQDLDEHEALARHWRSEASFDEVLGLANNHPTLEAHVPKRVLDAVRSFLEEV